MPIDRSMMVIAEFAREVESVAVVCAKVALECDGFVQGIVAGGGHAASEIGNARIEHGKLQIDFANLFRVVVTRKACLGGPCNGKPRDTLVTDLSEITVRVRDRAGGVGREPAA